MSSATFADLDFVTNVKKLGKKTSMELAAAVAG
jgi:hypothetical protein